MIHRDGILFYVYMLCSSGANLIITIAAPLDLIAMLIPSVKENIIPTVGACAHTTETFPSLQVVLHTMFTTRIVLNIRGVANELRDAELHDTYPESYTRTPPPRRHEHLRDNTTSIELGHQGDTETA